MVILVMVILAGAFGQAPYPRPTTPQVPKRTAMAQPPPGNRLPKLTPKKQLVARALTKGRARARKRRGK
jgi:hypothetical protein